MRSRMKTETPLLEAKAAGVDPNFFNFSGFVAKQPPDFVDVGPPAKKPKLVPLWAEFGSWPKIWTMPQDTQSNYIQVIP